MEPAGAQEALPDGSTDGDKESGNGDESGRGGRQLRSRFGEGLKVRVSVAVYGWDAPGIGHADGLDWAPNSVGAR